MKKEKATSLCHNCLESFTYSELYVITVPENMGPAHSVANCEKCCKKKGLDIKILENTIQYNKRILKEQNIFNK